MNTPFDRAKASVMVPADLETASGFLPKNAVLVYADELRSRPYQLHTGRDGNDYEDPSGRDRF